jgi:hypothetical protein
MSCKKHNVEEDSSKCRLRNYDAYMKVRMAVFDSYDSQLMDVKGIRSLSSLDLEIMDSETNAFEEWSEDTMYLKAVKWTEGQEYDFSRLHTLPTEVIAVNSKTDTTEDLQKQISDLYDIKYENTIIVLRHEKGHDGSISPEYFNMSWRAGKLLNDSTKFEHGFFLFVEDTDPTKTKFDGFNWV